MKDRVDFDGGTLSLEQVVAVADGAEARLGGPGFRARIDAGAAMVDRLLNEGVQIYGVNTGYGDSVTLSIEPGQVALLPEHLTEYHGVGLGNHFSPLETRAILAARLSSLGRGFSGVSFALLEGLAALLNLDIVPLIPEEGSVGASGDLTPLSYVSAVLCGRREAIARGVRVDASQALAAQGLKPYRLRPKEGLALMNGTAVMTGLACLNYERARQLAAVCTRVTSLGALALKAGTAHFEAGLFETKPFVGQALAASRIRQDLLESGRVGGPGRLQERYSIRCAPHVLGVLEDSLPWYRAFIETELNSSNDNPLLDPVKDAVYHGGHFYGGHICHVMDSMKAACASLADLVDRQIALLVDARYSQGLAPNLRGIGGSGASAHHGLKALQITASACAAEAQKLTMPASAFSRSTESHNQDKVSLGTIAARDCRRVLELSEQVAACGLLAACQALELRLASEGLEPATLRGGAAETLAFVRSHSAPLREDRALEADLRRIIAVLRARGLHPYGVRP
ncbi:MAG TPA: aromatic amino acid ammonia-lyase [bacterium]|jgi:histidine ammonia-lyase|nr:aromatic amino acid ammonia-lyase [bacterium]